MSHPSLDPTIASLLGWLTLAMGLLVVLVVTLRDRRIARCLLAAFALRAAFALVQYYVVPLPDSHRDARTFERIGWEWSTAGFFGVIQQFETGAFLYSWVIAVIYSITDRSPLMVQGINVLFGTLIVYNVYKTCALLWGERLARRAAWAAAFTPMLVLYSAITLREVAVTYPLSLGVLYLTRWYVRGRLSNLVLALASFAASLAFHTAMLGIFIALVGVVLVNWVRSWVTSPARFVRIGAAVLMGATAVTLVATSGWGLQKIGGDLGALVDLERLERQQELYTDGRARYPDFLIVDSPSDLAWQGPLRVIYLFFTPFPWMVRTPLDALGLVNVGVNGVLALLLVRNIRRIRSNQAANALFWILLVIIGILALSTSNYGTAARHAAKLLPLFLCLARFPSIRMRTSFAYRETPYVPDNQPGLRRRGDAAGPAGHPA